MFRLDGWKFEQKNTKGLDGRIICVLILLPGQFWGGEHLILQKQGEYNLPSITSVCVGRAGPVEHVEQLDRGLRGGTVLFGVRSQHRVLRMKRKLMYKNESLYLFLYCYCLTVSHPVQATADIGSNTSDMVINKL